MLTTNMRRMRNNNQEASLVARNNSFRDTNNLYFYRIPKDPDAPGMSSS